uniref:Uncharacterized protein n=1 Tax=Mycena chlorophos TaxID=658473 RepID=A0ABQ0LGI8_MYCCL|nr:predicted protein [Mycena chlorophos]
MVAVPLLVADTRPAGDSSKGRRKGNQAFDPTLFEYFIGPAHEAAAAGIFRRRMSSAGVIDCAENRI